MGGAAASLERAASIGLRTLRRGGEEKSRSVRIADVVEPCPAHIRVGMAVGFRPSVNPPGGKYGGRPIALEVRFVPVAPPPVAP